MSLKSDVKPDAQTLFDELRAGFAFVSDHADHVRINQDRLRDFSQRLPSKPPENVLDEQHHYIGDEESTAAYILLLEAINFGSGYKPFMVQEGWELIDQSIYFTVSTRLKDVFQNQARDWRDVVGQMSELEFADIFALDMTEPYSREFIKLGTAAIKELDALIHKEAEGSYFKFVKNNSKSAASLLQALLNLSKFQDKHSYKGQEIAFYKRAQIAVADLHLAYQRLGQPLFQDLDQLTIFADNALPHVLRMNGVLEYSSELAGRVDRGEIIPSGSAEEVEIRACAAHAAELIAKAKSMPVMNVDHILWHASVENRNYHKAKPHRTLTTHY